MNYPLFFSLPQELILCILKDWLADLYDLSHFDVACSPGDGIRQDFLSILRHPACHFHSSPHIMKGYHINYLEWLSSREIHLEEVTVWIEEIETLASLSSSSSLRLQHIDMLYLYAEPGQVINLPSITTTTSSTSTSSSSTSSSTVLYRFFQSFPHLRAINVTHWHGLTDVDLSLLIEASYHAIGKIQAWNLNNCPGITNESVEKLIQRFYPVLEEIRMDISLGVTSETLRLIAMTCKKLKAIAFETSGMMMEDILLLCKECKLLRSLHIVFRRDHHTITTITNTTTTSTITFTSSSSTALAITDDLIAEIVHLCPKLIVLDLSGCDGPTMKSFHHVITSCSDLHEFASSQMEYTVYDELQQTSSSFSSNSSSSSSSSSSSNNNNNSQPYCEITLLNDSMSEMEIWEVLDLIHYPLRLFHGRDGCAVSAMTFCQLAHRHGKDLRTLSLLLAHSNGSSSAFTDSSMATALSYCNKLVALELEGCQTFTDKLLQMLPKHCPHLREISLVDGIAFSENAMSTLLVSYASQIKRLNVEGCAMISDALLESILRVRPPLITVLDIRETTVTFSALLAFVKAMMSSTLLVLNIDEDLVMVLKDKLSIEERSYWMPRLNAFI